MLKSILGIAVIFALCCGFKSNVMNTYPKIHEIERTFNVPDVQNASVKFAIHSIDGTPVYQINCHSAGYAENDDFEYTGDFECRMFLEDGKNIYSTLFTSDINQSRDWESRARFFSANLKGDCSFIDNFGSKRTFKLRGMLVTLKIVNPRFNRDGSLISLKLVVSVHKDASATRPIAEPVPLPSTSPPNCQLGRYFAPE